MACLYSNQPLYKWSLRLLGAVTYLCILEIKHFSDHLGNISHALLIECVLTV